MGVTVQGYNPLFFFPDFFYRGPGEVYSELGEHQTDLTFLIRADDRSPDTYFLPSLLYKGVYAVITFFSNRKKRKRKNGKGQSIIYFHVV